MLGDAPSHAQEVSFVRKRRCSFFDKDAKEQRKQKIFDLWLAGWTGAEIADAVGLSEKEVGKTVSDLTAELPKGQKVHADHATDFDVPIYNVWKQQTKSEGSGHFGNSEVRWVDNLLYLYTKPFDLVLDPFAVAWLKINEPAAAIGIDDVKAKVAEAREKKEKQQGKRNDLTSTKLDEVKSSNTNTNVLRRLARDCPEMLDRIETGELSVNQAAIQAGIRKKPTPEEICIKAFFKVENRMGTLRKMIGTLEPHERAMVRRLVVEPITSHHNATIRHVPPIRLDCRSIGLERSGKGWGGVGG